ATRAIGMLAGAAVAAILGSAPASAGGYCSEMQLNCENGRTYPVCPIAVSDQGELVTGHLVLAPRRGIHVRLVPMGQGYRYIGRGIYFEGIREQAVLYLSKDRPIACTVVRG